MKLDSIKFRGSKTNPKALGRLPDQGTIVLSGKTNSGKSTQVRDILKAKQDIFSYAFCISETESVNRTFFKSYTKEFD